MQSRTNILKSFYVYPIFYYLQTEIVKRMSAIIGQVLPFLSQEHQQQVATAVERAKQVTMSDLNSVVGVSICIVIKFFFTIRK
jgi:hypothetical protein